MTDAHLAQIAERLSGLEDLFRRRLLEDKDKQRAFDELYSQLEFAKRGLVEQFFHPLVLELALLLDRMSDQEVANPTVTALREELLELLRRRGVEELTVGSDFDPTCHEAVATQAVVDHELVGQVVSVSRAGYVFGERVIRPARVVVGVSDSEMESQPASFNPAVEENDARAGSELTESDDRV